MDDLNQTLQMLRDTEKENLQKSNDFQKDYYNYFSRVNAQYSTTLSQMANVNTGVMNNYLGSFNDSNVMAENMMETGLPILTAGLVSKYAMSRSGKLPSSLLKGSFAGALMGAATIGVMEYGDPTGAEEAARMAAYQSSGAMNAYWTRGNWASSMNQPYNPSYFRTEFENPLQGAANMLGVSPAQLGPGVADLTSMGWVDGTDKGRNAKSVIQDATVLFKSLEMFFGSVDIPGLAQKLSQMQSAGFTPDTMVRAAATMNSSIFAFAPEGIRNQVIAEATNLGGQFTAMGYAPSLGADVAVRNREVSYNQFSKLNDYSKFMFRDPSNLTGMLNNIETSFMAKNGLAGIVGNGDTLQGFMDLNSQFDLSSFKGRRDFKRQQYEMTKGMGESDILMAVTSQARNMQEMLGVDYETALEAVTGSYEGAQAVTVSLTNLAETRAKRIADLTALSPKITSSYARAGESSIMSGVFGHLPREAQAAVIRGKEGERGLQIFNGLRFNTLNINSLSESDRDMAKRIMLDMDGTALSGFSAGAYNLAQADMKGAIASELYSSDQATAMFPWQRMGAGVNEAYSTFISAPGKLGAEFLGTQQENIYRRVASDTGKYIESFSRAQLSVASGGAVSNEGKMIADAISSVPALQSQLLEISASGRTLGRETFAQMLTGVGLGNIAALVKSNPAALGEAIQELKKRGQVGIANSLTYTIGQGIDIGENQLFTQGTFALDFATETRGKSAIFGAAADFMSNPYVATLASAGGVVTGAAGIALGMPIIGGTVAVLTTAPLALGYLEQSILNPGISEEAADSANKKMFGLNTVVYAIGSLTANLYDDDKASFGGDDFFNLFNRDAKSRDVVNLAAAIYQIAVTSFKSKQGISVTEFASSFKDKLASSNLSAGNQAYAAWQKKIVSENSQMLNNAISVIFAYFKGTREPANQDEFRTAFTQEKLGDASISSAGDERTMELRSVMNALQNQGDTAKLRQRAQSDPQSVERQKALVSGIGTELRSIGVDLSDPATAIKAVIETEKEVASKNLGPEARAKTLVEKLKAAGIHKIDDQEITAADAQKISDKVNQSVNNNQTMSKRVDELSTLIKELIKDNDFRSSIKTLFDNVKS